MSDDMQANTGQQANVTPLHASVQQSVDNFFEQLGDQTPSNVYDMVLAEVEEPLLKVVMRYTRHNQSQAAVVLGLSRGTLRKKLKRYGML